VRQTAIRGEKKIGRGKARDETREREQKGGKDKEVDVVGQSRQYGCH
jgi:hypothetical protein